MSAHEAVCAACFAAVSDTIELSNRILHATERDLLAWGYPVKRHPQSYTFAWVHAIRQVDGRLDGGADPATGGMALSV
jgi:gamma-glutamyltranspeptidase/glutathione hydrolase